jgi:hypothetical protein
MPELEEWESFYVIVGGAAGALIGLQFVVLTLMAERPSAASVEAGPSFSTPTILHFSAALLLSALLRAPWHNITHVALLCGALGMCGVVYILIVLRRMLKQSAYKLDAEDWAFHIVLPLIAYLLLAIMPLPSLAYERETLFAIGAGVLMLLFIGIHNAWDTIAYQVFVMRKPGQDETH